MPDSMEKQVADGIIKLAAARPVIIAGSIPVILKWDKITSKMNKFLSIFPHPNERVAPNYPFYYVECDVIACTNRKNDPKADELHPLVYEAEAIVNLMSDDKGAALATASGLTIDGIVPVEGADFDAPEDVFVMFSARVKVALQFTFT